MHLFPDKQEEFLEAVHGIGDTTGDSSLKSLTGLLTLTALLWSFSPSTSFFGVAKWVQTEDDILRFCVPAELLETLYPRYVPFSLNVESLVSSLPVPSFFFVPSWSMLPQLYAPVTRYLSLLFQVLIPHCIVCSLVS